LLSDNGRLSTNRRTGRITITDYHSNLKVLEGFIDFFKREAMRQIHIKAKVLEVTLTDGSQFGIDWKAVFSVGSTAVTLAQPFANRDGTSGAIVDRFNPFSPPVTGNTVGGNLDVLIEALEVQGQVKVLSSPQVTTLNGQTAIIRSITEDVVFQQTTNNTTAGQSETTTADPFVYGVFLGVTPHADSEGTITMDIHPSVSSLVTIKTFGGAQRPVIDTRETQTVVSVEDKEIIVIAGLMQDDVRNRTSKFPVLGDIPYLGKVFRKEENSSEKSELVILLTPTIVGHSAKDFGSIRDKFKLLERGFKNL
jgi:MSHA biogenesis protein MshL